MSLNDDRLPSIKSVLVGEVRLAARTAEMLRNNDMGAWTKAAPDLYRHQWKDLPGVRGLEPQGGRESNQLAACASSGSGKT
jgi:hypothetical protein